MKTRIRFVSSLVVIAAACAQHKEVATDTTSEELRALAAAEVLGDIGLGETRGPLTYTSTPTYRALRLTGNAGDGLDVWVRSANGDARVWLLDARFKDILDQGELLFIRDLWCFEKIEQGAIFANDLSEPLHLLCPFFKQRTTLG